MKLHRNNVFYTKMEQHSVQQAATAGLQSLHNLTTLLCHHQTNTMSSSSSSHTDYSSAGNVTVTNFRKFISLLDHNRTGYARYSSMCHRKDFPMTTISFAGAQANSFKSLVAGENVLSFSIKRKCNSMDDFYTGRASSSCYSKKRYH
ncbi:hypothetical protein Hanom_Chr09g00849001 [Helianthus anomalus]